MAEMENMEHRAWDDWRYGNRGVANAGLATGIVGTALGVLNGGLGLMGNGRGGFGCGNGYGYNGYGYNGYNGAVCVDKPVAKETFELQKQISAKDSEISLLKSEANTEVKIADVYSRLKGDILEQERINNARQTAQLVWNARQEARIAVLERDVSQLYGMTGLYVEAKKVTPLPMQRYNFWQAPTEPAPDAVAPQA